MRRRAKLGGMVAKQRRNRPQGPASARRHEGTEIFERTVQLSLEHIAHGGGRRLLKGLVLGFLFHYFPSTSSSHCANGSISTSWPSGSLTRSDSSLVTTTIHLIGYLAPSFLPRSPPPWPNRSFLFYRNSKYHSPLRLAPRRLSPAFFLSEAITRCA